MSHHDVVIVGCGHAGLAMSYCLTQRCIEHVVLERDLIASSWRTQRWDSFCLVTPNWQCRLPGFPYPGDDPDGFMLRDEILEYIDNYIISFDPPVREGVAVTRVSPGFTVETSDGTLTAGQVVLAAGGYHRPKTPAISAAIPDDVLQLHSSQYRSPVAMPDGATLVVGSGQSGAQIAEDLRLAGRDVHLCVGSAPRVARFYRGRDCVAWLHDMGHYRLPISEHPEGLKARNEANHYVTGRDGGRDIDLRQHALDGMRLHGRLSGVTGRRLSIAGDLARNLDAADATAERIKDAIDRYISANAIDAPAGDRYVPVWRPPDGWPEWLHLDTANIRSIIWATGFTPDWSWVDGFPDTRHPDHIRGVCEIDGLYVLGLPWLHTWGSGRFAGIAEDAEHLAEHVEQRVSAWH